MAPIQKELTIERGADYSKELRIVHTSNSANMNVVSHSFDARVRKGFLTSTLAGNLTCYIVDGANGVINTTMTSANTANIEPGRYVFDIIRTDTNGQKTMDFSGIINIESGVSR